MEGLRNRFPDDPTLLMGDWNVGTSNVGFVEEWVPSMGSVCRWKEMLEYFSSRGGDNAGDIDHEVVDKSHIPFIRSVRVISSWDSSDHWPLVAEMIGT